MPSVSGNVGAVASVSSVFGRNGGVVAANGDYSGVVAAHLTGATAATRYVGGTASGAPVAGTFAVGDFVIEQTGKVYVCTVAGTPGTWVAPGGGSSLVTQVTAILTPAMVQASHTTIIELAPAPGAGKAYIDATSLWIFGAGFTAYGGVFAPNLALGEDLAQTTVVFEQAGINSLYQALTGGAAGNVLGTWFGGMVQQSWSDPLSLLDNCPYYFSTSAAPTGGAGDITVVSAMTTLTLP